MKETELEDAKMVQITEREYQRLLKCREKLDCLESYGVDNWIGYSDAMKEFYKEEEE